MDPGERDALLQLTLVSGFSPVATRRAMEAMGSAQVVLASDPRDLAAAAQITPSRAEKVRRALDGLANGEKLAQEKELIEEHQVTLVALGDSCYPPLLRHIGDPPPLLYVRGQLREEDAVSLAVVGSRRCTHYGRAQADRLSSLCVAAGLCIISGGAFGIDAAAHRAALRAGGRTIAVIGSGHAKPYPEQHVALFEEITASGAIVSELPMTTPPEGKNFPARNRIISGLALGVLVVEAATRSGALITARLAAEDHGREVMALPGRIDSTTSEGCHKIIREGWAMLVTNLSDILDSLGETGALLKAGGNYEEPEGEAKLLDRNLTNSQRRVIEALQQPCSLDELAVRSGLSMPMVQSDLTVLQIRGLIHQSGGMVARARS